MKQRIAALVLATVMTTAVAGCAGTGSHTTASAQTETQTENTQEVSQQFYAMDTVMTITAYGEDAQAAVDESIRYINDLEQKISRTDDSTELYALNENGEADLSDETLEILTDALELAQESDGFFDPTIANLSDLWQIGTEEQHIPKRSEIKQAKSLIGYDRIKMDGNHISLGKGMRIDLGGIGKGYAADRVVEIMQAHGVERAIIALGGNVYVMGEKTEDTGWKVGITDPDNSSDYLGVLEVSDTSVVTSGDYERYFEQDGVRYCHIFDIRTGYPAQTDIRSVTIVDGNSTRADAFTTALFVMGYDKAVEFCAEHNIEAVFVLSDGTVHTTEGLTDSFELQSNTYTYEE